MYPKKLRQQQLKEQQQQNTSTKRVKEKRIVFILHQANVGKKASAKTFWPPPGNGGQLLLENGGVCSPWTRAPTTIAILYAIVYLHADIRK